VAFCGVCVEVCLGTVTAVNGSDAVTCTYAGTTVSATGSGRPICSGMG